ncbi:MAG: adenylate/guanylate cyclase domain-containing protein [Acidimicrobiales bacterium]
MSGHGDERRVVTVLFGDLVGFTALAETMDPEAVKALVDRVFQRLVRDIVEYGGRVDKILGDAIVALFGAPVAHEDDAERAVRAALAMQQTMRAYSAEVGAEIQMRIGVNTGEVLTGAMRAGGEYTAMGDVVNTASRLQSAAPPGEVYVGRLTHDATIDVVAYQPIGPVQARGRDEPIDAYQAIDILLLPGRRPRSRDTQLVGRDPEFALLRSAITRAFAQRRTLLVMVLGDAGVGKTRLADDVVGWVEREKGARMLESHCVPYGEANIWYPIGSALRMLFNVADRTPLEEARKLTLAAVVDLLALDPAATAARHLTTNLMTLMGYQAERPIDPQRAREEASRALIQVLEAATARQPVLFRLADLHWADDLVLEVIDEVIDGLGRNPFVLVATARHLIDARWKPRTGRHDHLIVNLDPLDAVAAGQLLDQLLAGAALAEIDADTRRLLLARSGGNPFFLEELVALLERQGASGVDALQAGGDPAASRAGAAVGVSAGPGRQAAELPETLRGLIAARLDRLGPNERAVLDNASVLGRSGGLFSLETMCTSMGLEALWRAAFDVLVDQELLNLAGDRWSFRSDVMREVAYGTLTKSDRARRHAEIARWMEDHRADIDADVGVIDRIAHHYAQAASLANELSFGVADSVELTDKALSWLALAGERALHGEVYVLAARLYSQGLDLTGREPSSQRLSFLLGRAEARFGLLEMAGAHADIDEAIKVADVIGDRLGRTRACLVAGEIIRREGDVEAALKTLTGALADFRALGDRPGEAEALRLIGIARQYQRSFGEAEESTSAALGIFRELDDRRGQAWALQNLAWISYLSGRVTEAEGRIDASAAAFISVGDTGGLSWANALLAFTRFHQGRLVEAEGLAEEILPDSRVRGDRFGEGMMLLLTALVRLWSGRTADAIERAEHARNHFIRVGDPVGQLQAQAALSRALVASGTVPMAFTALEEVYELPARVNPPRGGSLVAIVWTAAALHVGDLARAEQHLAEMDLADDLGMPSGWDRSSALGLYHLQTGEVEQARAVLREAVERAGTEVSPGLIATLALADVAAGDTVAALSGADRAHESTRSTYLDMAYCYMAAGLAHAIRGDFSEVIAAFAAGRQEVDLTGDVVAQAIVRRAEGYALGAVGATSARSVAREADRRWRDIGAEGTGWDTVFRLATTAKQVLVPATQLPART